MSRKRHKNFSILLVSIHPSPSAQAVPLAMAFLKGFAAGFATEVELVDFFVDQNVAECVATLVKQKPAAIGFSMYVWNRPDCLALAAELRRRVPEVLLFAGGPEVTADAASVLEGSALDFVITGEGEAPFAALCARLASQEDFSDIPGIVMEGSAIPKALPGAVADLDSIPSPYLSGMLDSCLSNGILWQLSRGCSFACEFCFDSRGRHGVRRFSLKRIEDELRYFASHGVSQVFVLDSTFNQDMKRAKTILRLIRKIAPHIHFHFEVRSEFIDRELAQLFARITCSLQIGLQSSDSAVLKNVGRAFHREDFTARVNLLNEAGAVFGFDLIYGLPGDTLEGFRKSLDFAIGLYPNHLDIFPLSILPGTTLAGRAGSAGLVHQKHPPYTLLSSPTFSAAEMSKSRRLATACDIFYTRGKAVAWFNCLIASIGLSPSAFLVHFIEWLDSLKGEVREHDLEDHEIWGLQQAFLKELFESKGRKRLLPVVLDVVNYHYHYAAALLSPPERATRKKPVASRLLQTPLRLASSVRLAQFTYEIMDILESGAPEIRRLADTLKPVGSFAAIYPSTEGVCTESLAEPYFRLLERLNSMVAPEHVCTEVGLAPDEALEFLTFALDEKIIVPT